MKIMHIAECAGGVDIYISMLAPLLKNQNISQFFLCSFNYNIEKYKYIFDDIKQIEMHQTFSFIKSLREIKKIRKYIKQMHPDIVYCHSSFAGGLGRIAAIGLSCKVIYNPHGWAFNIK